MQATIKKAKKKSDFYKKIHEAESAVKARDQLERRSPVARRLAKSEEIYLINYRELPLSFFQFLIFLFRIKSNVQNRAIKCDGLRPPTKVKVLYESLSHGEDFEMRTGFGFGFVTDWFGQRWQRHWIGVEM